MVTTTHAVRLTERDEQIFREHFARFRITTVEALQRVYWSDHTVDAAKKWAQRMRLGRYLLTGVLGDGRRFLYPTSTMVAQAELPRRIARPPKGYDLARLYGVLSFCCLGETRHEKISSVEFHRRFEHLCAKSLDQSLYYVDTDFADGRLSANKRIGYLLIDAGARVSQIVSRFRHVVSHRLNVPLWHQWIERGRFIVTVVTADPDKQRQLREALTAIRQPVPFRVEIRRDLRDAVPLRVPHAS